MSEFIVAAHQANFLPNLGFFYKMQQADTFVLISNLQFEKQEKWQQRNRIPGVNGDIWLTTPVLGSQNQRLKDVKINNQLNWNRKHKQTIKLNYGKSEEKDFLNKLEEIYDSKPERLVDLNIRFIQLIKERLNIPTKLVVDEDVSGDKHELLINICKKYNAKTYLSGNGARSYMTEEYLSRLKENNVSHNFLNNPLSEYPYSALHYIASERSDAVIQKLKRKEILTLSITQ